MCQKGAVSHSEEEQLHSPLSHEPQGPEMNPACHRKIDTLHFQQHTAFHFSPYTRSFLTIGMTCLPIRRRVSSEALLAELHFSFGHGPNFSILWQMKLTPGIPTRSLLLSLPLLWRKKKKSSNYMKCLFFPCRARMLGDGLAASINRCCFLVGLGSPCCSLAQCSRPNALIIE